MISTYEPERHDPDPQQLHDFLEAQCNRDGCLERLRERLDSDAFSLPPVTTADIRRLELRTNELNAATQIIERIGDSDESWGPSWLKDIASPTTLTRVKDSLRAAGFIETVQGGGINERGRRYEPSDSGTHSFDQWACALALQSPTLRTKTVKRFLLLCCLAISPACTSTTPPPKYLELAPNPQGINQAIAACRAAPTPHCRDSMLVEGMAYYKFVFLDQLAGLLGPHLVGVSNSFDLLDVGSQIALANVQGEREQKVIPIVGLVANGLQKIFWPANTADRREAKAARMESDLLRLEAKIEERFGADLNRYPVAEALVDLRRFQDAATGVAYN